MAVYKRKPVKKITGKLVKQKSDAVKKKVRVNKLLNTKPVVRKAKIKQTLKNMKKKK